MILNILLQQSRFLTGITSKLVTVYITETPHRPKIRSGGGSNMVGIICPLVGIGLTDLPKMGGGASSGICALVELFLCRAPTCFQFHCHDVIFKLAVR